MASEAYRHLVGGIPEHPHTRHLDELVTARFAAKQEFRAQRQRIFGPMYEKLAGQLGADLEAAARELRQVAEPIQQLRAPTYEDGRAVERVRTGSIDIFRVAPFDYAWTGRATDGDCAVEVNAEKDGTLLSYESTGAWGGSGSGTAAVGVYFKPTLGDLGLLAIAATPLYSYQWRCATAFGSCSSDAWIGLYVGEYELDGKGVAQPVLYRNSLWSHSDSPFGLEGDSGGGVAGLSFPPILVDSKHFYVIWVWAGGDAYSNGVTSYGGSSVSIIVPWIGLQYFVL